MRNGGEGFVSSSAIKLDTGASILFVGNSFTFARVDPVLSYNTANVRDLTAPVPGTSFANTTGSNPYEPHPWGGVPGIFQVLASQMGLEYDVAISARNAATLQGQYLNSNPAGWDLRGNVASQKWDTLVLQDNSTQPLPSGAGTVTFLAGSSTATVVLDPTADTKVETDETLTLKVAAGTGYRTSSGGVTGTILNDDPTGPTVNPALPTVTLVASPGAVLEDGPDNLVYTFTRTGSTATDLKINFTATRDGSTAPSVNTSTGDLENFVTNFTTSFKSNGGSTTGSLSFTTGGGSVIIKAGASTATFTLDPRPDLTVETDESIRLTLSADAAYNVGTPGAVAATILNDDFPAGTDLSLPNITLNLATAAVYEDSTGALAYQFTRTGSTASPLTVRFTVSGTATLPSQDFTVTGADTFTTGGASDPNLDSFKTYAVKLAQYATTGSADGSIPANPNANTATDVYLYETWARPNLVVGAQVATTNDTTGVVTTTTTTAPEYYASLEDMTADLRAAYEGLAAANPIFKGVAPVGAAFLNAVQNGTATRNPYAADAGTDGKIDLWWDDNLHASKYGSYLSALTLFATITGLDPRSLGAGEKAAADLGITQAEATALQAVAAATLGLTLNAHWTAPGQVTEIPNGSGLLATAGAFTFSDADVTKTHTVSVMPLTSGALGTLDVKLHTDSEGDGTGGAVNWTYTVDNAAVAVLGRGETRVEKFLVQVSDGSGGVAQREVDVTINGTYDDPPVITSNGGSDTASITIDENTTFVTKVAASDPDGPPLTYSIVPGGDSALFKIDGKSGVLSFAAAPDYEQPADGNGDNVYTVTVQVSDGTSADTQAISVKVNNVGASPVIGGTVAPNAGRFFLPASNTLTMADLFTATGDTALKYRFYDANATAGSGSLYLDGVMQPARQAIDVSAADLSRVTFRSQYVAGGRDDILVQLWDGTSWSDPVTLPVMSDHLTVASDGNVHVIQGAVLSGTSLVSALTFSDADGNAPVQFRFTDTDSSAGSGYFTLAGAVIAANTPVTVTTAQLSSLQFHASASNIAERVQFEVSDGVGFGNAANFTIFTDAGGINRAPVVVGSVQRAHAAGDHISAASLIASYSDADGQAAQRWRFYDTNADVASGSFYLDGVQQAARTTIELSAADLGRLEFRSSTSISGTASRDDIQIQASDGITYSALANAVIQTTRS